MQPVEWLIDGILPARAVAVMYGAYSTYKSFVALDWAAHVAMGMEWQGRSVKPGTVLYIAGEGGSGQRYRLKAWECHHQVDIPDGRLYWYTQPLAAQKDEDFTALVQAINLDMDDWPSFIIFDTLNRCTDGMDENSTREVGALINKVTRLAQAQDVTVLFIHHSGKDTARKARGSSVIISNADIAIEVASIDMVCTLTAEKMKGAERFKPIDLELLKVSFGSEKGENSLVVTAPTQSVSAARISAYKSTQQTMLDALGDESLTFAEWKKAAAKMGINESTAAHWPKKLVDKGLVMKLGDKYVNKETQFQEVMEELNRFN